jgi:hypothetical protein
LVGTMAHNFFYVNFALRSASANFAIDWLKMNFTIHPSVLLLPQSSNTFSPFIVD